MVPDPGYIAKQLSTPEAHYVAELSIMNDDLLAAAKSFDLFFNRYTGSKEGDDRLIADALFRDAVILFCSAFDKTNHIRLVPEEVYATAPEGALETYYQLQDIRDTYAAHTFGPLRQHNIAAQCKREDGQLKPVSIGHQFATFGGWNANEKVTILGTVGIAGKYNLARLEKSEVELWQHILKLTPEELEALPDLNVGLPYPDEWRSGRKSFHQNTKQRRTIDPRDLKVKTPSQP